jgi:hypothetical protein
MITRYNLSMEKITITKNGIDAINAANDNYSIQTLLGSYDPELTSRALDILLKNKINEVKQIAEDIGYLATEYTDNNWQEKVIQFCLEVYACFKDISKIQTEDEAHKCMSLMQIMAYHKTLNEAQKLQWLAYNIAQDFRFLYERVQ